MERKLYEEYGYVLDYLPQGKAGFGKGYIAEPTVQIVGEVFFTLLEAIAKPNATINLHERVYVGKDQREKISHIIGRVNYEELTPTAKSELPVVIEEMVKLQESKFVEFFNKAQPITPRMHSFELLPGIGKKYMWQIVNERDKKSFTNFKEIQERANVPDPIKAIVRRILDELTSDQKYRVFTRQV